PTCRTDAGMGSWRRGALSPLPDAPNLLRRKLIGGSAGAFMIACPNRLLGRAAAAAEGTVLRAPYGSGFCSLGLFLAHARQLAAEEGFALELVATPTFADHVTFIGSGAVDISITPYTSVIALWDAGAEVAIIAGGGIEGCG